MPRHDFQKTTINLLRKRAGGHCCNPSCQVATEGPGKEPDVGVVLGIAAHITAASPGGPRYDAGMTKTQRQSHENGIWLCTGCATLIDRDVAGHPVDLLLNWRAQAEDWARSRLNRRPVRDGDAADLLASALAGSPVSLSPRAIRNVHEATSMALERLDSRFLVASSFDGETTFFTLKVKEPVNVHLTVPVADGPEWDKQLSALRDHGQVATLPMASVSASGSPLIQAIFQNGARGGAQLRFSPPSRSMRLTLSARDNSGNLQRLFRGDGEFVFGKNTGTFNADLFEGAVSFSLTRSRNPIDKNGTFTLATDLNNWSGQDVRELSKLDELIEFFEGLNGARELDVQLHLRGNNIFAGSIKSPEIDMLVGDGLAYLGHLFAVREIAVGLGLCIRVSSGPISRSEIEEVRKVADIASGRSIYSASEVNSNPRCSIEDCEEGGLLRLLEAREPMTITYVEREGSQLNVLDQNVRLPPLEIVLESTRARLVQVVQTQLGKMFDIEWLREPGFRCIFRYPKIQQEVDEAPISY